MSSSRGLSCVFWLIISAVAEVWSAMVLSSVASWCENVSMSEWIFIRSVVLFFLAAKSKQLGREQHMWETWKSASFSAMLRAEAFSISQCCISLSHGEYLIMVGDINHAFFLGAGCDLKYISAW